MQLDHIVLNVRNQEAMLAFYIETMGFNAERLDAFRAGQVPFPSVRINEHTLIDLFPFSSDASTDTNQGNLNHFCLALQASDWHALQQRLDQAQVAVDGPHQRWGAHGAGESYYFFDPDGNEIEAKCYSPPDRERA